MDEEQIKKAQLNCPQAHCWQGQLPDIPTPPQSYDAVFAFGVLHHIPDWQEALSAMANVTKPGGQLYLLEYYKALICHPLIKRLLDHPQNNRFSHQELLQACQGNALRTIYENHTLGLMGMVIVQKT